MLKEIADNMMKRYFETGEKQQITLKRGLTITLAAGSLSLTRIDNPPSILEEEIIRNAFASLLIYDRKAWQTGKYFVIRYFWQTRPVATAMEVKEFVAELMKKGRRVYTPDLGRFIRADLAEALKKLGPGVHPIDHPQWGVVWVMSDDLGRATKTLDLGL